MESPRVVRLEYDINRGVNSLALSPSHRLVAVGSSAEIHIYKVEQSNEFKKVANLNRKFKDTTFPPSITDVKWSPLNNEQVAVAYSSGLVSIVKVTEESFRSSYSLKEKWNYGQIFSPANAVCWNPVDSNVLASAHQDGILRILDFRQPTNPCHVTQFGSKALNSGVKDVKYNPFQPFHFAEVSENGNLKIWDQRFNLRPIFTKTKAHPNHILTVDWHPTSEGVLATGSRDKTIKVWDSTDCTYNAVGPEPALTHTLFTSSEVSRISWSKPERGPSQLAAIFIDSGSKALAGSEGFVSIWDLSHKNVPVCILKGHGAEPCIGFSWISSNFSSKNKGNKSKKGKPGSSQPQTGRFGSIFPNSTPEEIEEKEVKDGPLHTRLGTLSSTEHILSVGRDGKLLLQQPLMGYFPYEHVTGSVVTISNAGHIAFQRGQFPGSVGASWNTRPRKLSNSSPDLASINVEGDNDGFTPGLERRSSFAVFNEKEFQDLEKKNWGSQAPFALQTAAILPTLPLPSVLGAQLDIPNVSARLTSSALLNTARSNKNSIEKSFNYNAAHMSAGYKPTGVIFIGLEQISDLETARNIRLVHHAEATVFDPALVALLARKYRVLDIRVRIGKPTISRGKGVNEEIGVINEQEGDRGLMGKEENSREILARSASDRSMSLGQVAEPTSPRYSSKAMINSTSGLSLTTFEQEELDLRRYQEAVSACSYNCQVAQAAGLTCRASLWAAVMTLIPTPLQKNNPDLSPFKSLGGGNSQRESSTFGFIGTGTNSEISLEVNGTGGALNQGNFSSNGLRSDGLKMGQSLNPFRNSLDTLPFTVEVLSGILKELLENGDSQHFVMVCEVLRNAGWLHRVLAVAQLNPQSILHIYRAYLELLRKLKLFSVATEVVRTSEDPEITNFYKRNVDIKVRCGGCLKDLQTSKNMTTGFCLNCSRCSTVCAICRKPIKGLMHWCPVCAHGGHIECNQKWFKISSQCPAGCGHKCCDTLLSSTDVLGCSESSRLVESRFNILSGRSSRRRRLRNLLSSAK